MGIKGSISKFLIDTIGIRVSFFRPKEMVKFAKNYFSGSKISVIEIGSLRGDNAYDVLSFLDVKKIYLVDPYLSYGDYISSEPQRTQISLDEDYYFCKRRLKSWVDSGVVEFKKDFSENVHYSLPSVDMLYIDGNHEYDYVLRDLENYYPKVKSGGLVGGDDFQCFGVCSAVLDFLKGKDIKLHTGVNATGSVDWWFIK